MLTGFTILIAEDEGLVAADLAWAVEAMNGKVVGPFATVAEALSLLEDHAVNAAIVDANLADRDVTPLALRLLEGAIPFVVHTGQGLPDALGRSHPDLPVAMKPTSSTKVVELLMGMMSGRSQ